MDLKPWNHVSEAHQASILEDIKAITEAGERKIVVDRELSTSRTNKANNRRSIDLKRVRKEDPEKEESSDSDYSPPGNAKRKQSKVDARSPDTGNEKPSLTIEEEASEKYATKRLRRRAGKSQEEQDDFLPWSAVDDNFQPVGNQEVGKNFRKTEETSILKENIPLLESHLKENPKTKPPATKPKFQGKLTFKAKPPSEENQPTKSSNSSSIREKKIKGSEKQSESNSTEMEPTEEYTYRYNNDFCSACHGSGNFLCCETCPNSFHFSCIDPPIEETNLPDGAWYCNNCRYRSLYGEGSDQEDTEEKVKKEEDSMFQLPYAIRSYFQGIGIGVFGEYLETDSIKQSRAGRKNIMDDRDAFLLRDQNGAPVCCYHCQSSVLPSQSMVVCDYCLSYWHPDCLSPPLSTLPSSIRKWKCPNHAEHVTPRYRLPRRAKVIDVGLPRGFKNRGNIIIDDREDRESIQTIQWQGKIRVVPTKAFKLNFLEQIKDNIKYLEQMYRQNEAVCLKTLPQLASYASRDCEFPLRVLSDVANNNLNNDDYVLALRDLLRILRWDPSKPVPCPTELVDLSIRHSI
ncbi:Clr6 histone deacetylase associated PHD protein- 2 Cph2 [Schizosaccharomyces cryophilus OY26]|uniref:Clr6 histone deacetylase associated PHD protein-2 Cph2 n=1 Tax=Schizosaccharomyces cryophilus (strain OY26 / ATCC MYA-4695 / CBS 11777 / NBRC 106824 / NRRL Y48691) TaxID=653667 RepID=S9XAG8_SCHCR|nr:Clr6 histone deacetylase associated PHD protein- 2 Cph2 [Schizosaccharomyces cryophilus OY26]EPY54152.1 Clr6 histone deacetylase associated PHD protein- 2 Cph2 [Schizosaccharomyces cryophilus OY26]